MTETEWLETNDTQEMVPVIATHSERRLRLLACAVCASFEKYISDQRAREAVEASCLYADGLISADEFESASAAASDAYTEAFRADIQPARSVALYACELAATAGIEDWHLQDIFRAGGELTSDSDVAFWIREIVGNPFRDAECADEWRTDTVLAVARRAYDAREFGALPVLADALQDAGCDSADLLDHLRDPHAEHVRGCWALDLVLGKE